MSQRVELLPGVFLRTVQTDKFKTGSLSVNFLRPLCREEAAANALLPSVLLRGTKAHPDMKEISMLLDELYGAGVGTLVRKKGEVQTVGFYADFIEDKYTLEGENVFSSVCAFLRELLFEPVTEGEAFCSDFVESEKVNLCNAIAAEINDKRSYAVIRMLRAMCSGERYAVPRLGEKEAVEAVTPEGLYRQFQKVLAHSRVELLYVGRKSKEEVAGLLCRMLEGLPRGELAAVGTEVVERAEQVREVSEAMDVTQGKLSMGFRTGCTGKDLGYPALQVFNVVYGGGVSSKLFRNVRERMSLCYYASSSLEKHKGLMVVSSGIEFSNYEVAKAEILRQLEACRSGDISQEELEQAKAYLLSGMRASKDRPGSLDDFYLSQAILGLDAGIDEQMAALEAVNMEDVTAAARNVSLDTVYFLKGVGV